MRVENIINVEEHGCAIALPSRLAGNRAYMRVFRLIIDVEGDPGDGAPTKSDLTTIYDTTRLFLNGLTKEERLQLLRETCQEVLS